MSFGRCLAVFAPLVLIISANAESEPTEPDPVDGYTVVSFFLMLQTELVQKDLGLSRAQVVQVEELKESFGEVVQDLGKKYLELPTEQRNFGAIEDQVLEAALAHIPPQLKTILSKPQMTRLEQIEFQCDGVHSFRDAKVSRALQLSDDQRKHIEDLANSFNKATEFPREMFGFGEDGEALSPKRQEEIRALYQDKYWKLAQESVEKAINFVDAGQRKRLELLVGPKIDVRKLSEQIDNAYLTVMAQTPLVDGHSEGLTITVGDGGNFSVATLKVSPDSAAPNAH